MVRAGDGASTGTGEPDRTLALLWRGRVSAADPPRRGPKKSLDVDRVVDDAIALADADGLDAVTMRALARRMGVSTMSMYTYVPGKAELLDLMLDTLHDRMPRPPWRVRTWRRRLTVIAEANRQLLAGHPWAARIDSLSRPPLGPGTLTKYEHELSALDRTGLGDREMDAALTFLLAFVQAHARAADDARRTAAVTGQDDAAWWAANAPLLERLISPADYPRATRVGAAAGQAQGGAYHAQAAWEFGLPRVLDGLAAIVEPDRRRA
jgi:AcrR family transcriptional regulator